MLISKSGKPAVSLTCQSASPGSPCFQKDPDANPEKSGFSGKPSTPAHVRFFSKPFISFASAQLRLGWHSPCAIGAVQRREGPMARPKPLTDLHKRKKSMSQTKTKSKPIKTLGGYNKKS